MGAYYNEHDPKAAAWLRELIKRDLIAPGEVDERSIEDIRPTELAGFAQCHFFAGVGVWSYSLRQAGWPDSLSVWTGSCPCQPFSAAGKGEGFADERHLWPAWFHLISQCRPSTIFGEQVASKDGFAWLDLVYSDLEALDYAFGPTVLPAAGFGAPHGRHRIFFVADSARRGFGEFGNAAQPRSGGHADSGFVSGAVGHSESDNRRRGECGEEAGTRATGIGRRRPTSTSAVGGMADTERNGGRSDKPERETEERIVNGRLGPTNGFWRDAEWLYCRDEKYRATKPGIAPLVTGAPARVVRLRGYGNAINAIVAQEFVEAYLTTRSD